MKRRERTYDDELQMFVEAVREPSSAYLRFLRWLADRGLLEHEAAGRPTGEYAAVLRPELLLVP